MTATTASVLETARPISQSAIWSAQRAFYETLGQASWTTGIVPHRATTSAVLAHAYVRVVAAYIDDLRQQQRIDVTQPVHIIELGAGSGAFAQNFLAEWFRDKGLCPSPQPIHYVVTDVAQSNLDAFAKNPTLQGHKEKGRLSIAHFDAEHPAPLPLADGSTLFDGPTQNPVVIIANYVFDSLKTDAFAWRKPTLSEWQLQLEAKDASSEAPSGLSPQAHQLMVSERRFSQVAVELSRYANTTYQRVLSDHLQGNAISFPFPVASLDCLEWIAQSTGGRQLLLAADKGLHVERDFSDDRPPWIQEHGSLSLNVNFYALRRYHHHRGGYAWVSSRRAYPLYFAAMVLGEDEAQMTRSHWAFDDAFEGFNVGDFHQMSQARVPELVEKQNDLLFNALLSQLRLSHFDSFEYLSRSEELTRLIAELFGKGYDKNNVTELRDVLQQVVARVHSTVSREEITLFAGMHLLQTEQYSEALGFFGQSLQSGKLERPYRAMFGGAHCMLRLELLGPLRETYDLLRALAPQEANLRHEYDQLMKLLEIAVQRSGVSLAGEAKA